MIAHSEEYLRAYSHEHVFYEMEKVKSLAQVPGTGRTPAEAALVGMAVLEAWIGHARNVIEFLYPAPNGPRDTDICAAHFFATPADWIALAGQQSESLKKAKKRADKETAHLTTERIAGTPAEKAWDRTGLTAELDPLMRTFAANALRTRLDIRVRALFGVP